MSQTEIRRIKKTSNVTESTKCILIGSQAALKFLPHFREKEKVSLEYDMICSSTVLLQILENIDSSNEIDTIEMIIPTFNGEQLDLYINYVWKTGEKYDFVIPQSTTSYTAY